MKYIEYNNNIIEYEIVRKKIKNIYLTIKNGKVVVSAPTNISEEHIEALVTKKANWISKAIDKENKKQEIQDKYTEEEFIKIVTITANELIKQTNLRPNKMRIREIKYAWGSCSRSKNITINNKLIKYSKNAIRYVILHELCHIKYMNHSKKFWELVQTYMPNYKEIRKELK